MGDMAEDFKSLKDHKKALREKYGIECPECKRKRPKAHATILMPQQRCRVDGYHDPRPELTDEQWSVV
jgi:hypothetical protein